MRIAATTAWVALPIVAGVGLYLLKMQVEAQVQHLAGLERQIVETRESIHVLKAEWSFLNDPARLREQAERLLAMHPVRLKQLVTYDRIPLADTPSDPTTPSLSGPLAKAEPAPDALAAMIAALADANRSKRP